MRRIHVPLAISLFVSGLTLAPNAAALDVWVDAQNGSDTADGSEATPFATLGHAVAVDTADATLVVHVLPGTYREMFETQREGTSIVVAETDQGTAVLSGSEPSASLAWTREDPAGLPSAASGHVWWAQLDGWTLPPQILTQNVSGNVVRLTPAREPDFQVTTDWKWHEHWETAGAPLRFWDDEDPATEQSAHYLSASFLTNQWGDLTGGRVWIMDTHSGHDTYSSGILNHWVDEGTIETSRACEIPSGEDGIGAQSKYFVEGKLSLLDQEGEWVFDPDSSRIYLWPIGGADPHELDVEIAAREQGISVEHGDFLVDGLTFRGFNYENDYWNTRASALFVHTRSDATLEQVTIRNAIIEHAGRGIHAVASTANDMVTLDGLTIEDTRIAHTDGHAINVQSWPTDSIGARHVTIQRCIVEDTGFRNPEPTDSAGSVSLSRLGDVRFLDNEVAESPHNAVQFNYGCENVLIKGNHLHHCGLNAADNGCLKFWNNIDHVDASTPRSILVTANLVHDNMGWAYASEVNEWWQTTGLSGSGMYTDYYRGVTFYRNIIHTVGQTGLWPNTPSNLIWMINNTVINARHGASTSRSSMTTPDQGEAIVMNNLFMNFTTWGFAPDDYWGQLESGVLYSRTDDLLQSHHNGYHNVLHDMLYVDASNSGNKYDTVDDVQANTPYGEGSIDIGGSDDAVVMDAASFDVHPVEGSPVLDVGGELPGEMAEIFQRVGLTLDPPVGDAYDLGAIEGAGGPWLQVTFPNGGEVLPTGGEANVTWASSTFVGPVRIELATGYADAPSWQTLVDATDNDGAELVTLPSIDDPSCRIRISEAEDDDPSDISDADFEIGNAILVTAPTGGESLTVGESFSITWSAGGVDNVVIELSRDGGASFSELASGLPARDGAFAWTVSGPPAGDCVVRIIDAADADPVGLSGSFAIVDAASDAGGNEGNEDGCGCRIAGAASARAWLLLLLAVGLGRRRWRC